jgi:hypothetical protein
MNLPSFQEREEAVCTLACLLILKYTTSPPGIMGDFIRENASMMDRSSLEFIYSLLEKAAYSQEARGQWMEVKNVIGNELYQRSLKQ